MCLCENCGYLWQDQGEKYPQCHFDGPDGRAPCEQDDYTGDDYTGDED